MRSAAVVAWPGLEVEPAVLPGPQPVEVYAIGPMGRHVPLETPSPVHVEQAATVEAIEPAPRPAPRRRVEQAPALSEDVL
jgi:hypothetical protein